MSVYSVEYSKSSRAKCQKCKDAIPKDVIRFSTLSQGDMHAYQNYRHLPCVTPKVWSNALAASSGGTVESLMGFADLEPEDQEAVRAAAAGEAVPPEEEAPEQPKKKKAAPKKARATPKTPAKGRKRAQAEEEEEEEEEEESEGPVSDVDWTPKKKGGGKKSRAKAPTKKKGKMVTLEEQMDAEEAY